MRSKYKKETTNLKSILSSQSVSRVFIFSLLLPPTKCSSNSRMPHFPKLPLFDKFHSLSYFLDKIHTQTNVTDSLHTRLKAYTPAWKHKMTKPVLVILWFWWCPSSLMPLLVGVSCKPFGHWVVMARQVVLAWTTSVAREILQKSFLKGLSQL